MNPEVPETAGRREQLRRLLQREAPAHAALWEHHGRVPRAALRRLADAGLLGSGEDHELHKLLAVAEVLPYSGSRRLSAAVIGQLMVMRFVDRYGDSELHARLLEELRRARTIAALALPQDGEQLSGWGVRADRRGDGWLVSGCCPVLGGARECDLVLLAAVSGRRAFARAALSLLLLDLDSPGVSLHPSHDGSTLELQAVTVPDCCTLGREGRGGKHLSEQQSALRLLVAATALTMVEMSCEGLPHRVSAALAEGIERARREISGVAAKERRALRFRRAAAAAERRCRQVVEQLQSAKLRAESSWGLLDRCWRGLPPHATKPSGEVPAAEPAPKPSPPGTAAPAPRPTIELLLGSLPDRFRIERAAGLSATFHFVLGGADQPEWTVVTNDAGCRVEQGLQGEPDCVVRMKAATYLGIELAEINPQAAFLTGRVKISNPMLMMRYLKLIRPYRSGEGTG